MKGTAVQCSPKSLVFLFLSSQSVLLWCVAKKLYGMVRHFVLWNAFAKWTAWKNRKPSCRDVLCSSSIIFSSLFLWHWCYRLEAESHQLEWNTAKYSKFWTHLETVELLAASITKYLDQSRCTEGLAHLLCLQLSNLFLFYLIKSKKEVDTLPTNFRFFFSKHYQPSGSLE